MRAILGNLSDTDIRLLRVFIVVAQAGGLSAAELELNIGRSTISRHLKDLETRLGMVLCHRGRGGFALTEEGKRIYESTQRLLLSLQDFRNEVNDMHRHLQGNVVVAMFDKTVSNEACKVSDAIYAYQQQAPNVNVEIHVVPVNTIEQGILDGRYHIGIIPTHRTSSSLHYLPLFGEQMYLYCGAKHPLFSALGNIPDTAIRDDKYAGLSFHSPNMDKSMALGLNRMAVANDQEGIATLICSGSYLGFLPEHYAESFVGKGQMRAIEPANFAYHCDFAAIYRKSPKPTRLVKLFLDALAREHGKEAIIADD